MKIVGRLKAVLGLDKSKYDQGMKSARKEGDKFGKHMKKLGGIIAGFFAFAKLFQGIKKLIQKNAEFGQSLANLSAITGAVGGDLKFYEKQAKKIGASTTLAASEAVKAFELMGSARPELLKNKEALAAVTKEAVILAEASGMDLPTATQALAKAMNQFNIPAERAGEVINILAAGSKEGAEAIPGLADAIKVVGTAANMADISLQQTVGMIETLAEKGISGAESGTQLRNVILKLQSETDRFNPKVVGMAKALRNLAAENYSAAKLTEMFGLRNQQAAAILINNIGKFENYTRAVTGTNVAYEQQAVKVDTVKGKWKMLLSVIESNILQGQKFRDTMKDALEATTAQVPKVAEKLMDVRNAIVSVINYFIDLYNESVAIRYVAEGIGFAFKAVFGFIKLQIQSVIETFKGLGQIVKDIFTGNWDAIRDHANEAGGEIVEKWKEYADQMATDWQKAMENATSKKHVQLIEIKTVRGGGPAPAPGVTTPTDRRGGRALPSVLPTADFGRAKVNIEGMNKAMEESEKVVRKLMIAHVEGQLAMDVFAGMSGAIGDAFLESEDKLKAFGEFFGQFLKRMAAQLMGAAIAALALSAILSMIGGGGIGGSILGKLGLGKGASFGEMFEAGFFKFAGFQHGGTVPAGFPNDTFPAMLTTGETVLTPNQFNNLRDNRPIKIGAKVIGLRGRELRILIGREDEFMANVGT